MAATKTAASFSAVMSEIIKRDKNEVQVEQAAIQLESALRIELPTLDAEIARLKLAIKTQNDAIHSAIYSLNPNLASYDNAVEAMATLQDQLDAATEKRAEREALLNKLFPAG